MDPYNPYPLASDPLMTSLQHNYPQKNNTSLQQKTWTIKIECLGESHANSLSPEKRSRIKKRYAKQESTQEINNLFPLSKQK